MVACDSREPKAQPGATSSMEFNVELKSRTGVTGNDNLTAYPFAVYSDMTNLDPATESAFIPVMDATRVSYDSSSDQWGYDDTQYWFPGFQYSFVACHPADNQYVTEVEYASNKLEFTYTQPTDYKSASDLLIATHRRDYAGGTASPVSFSFSHILTNVNMLVSYKGSSSGPTSITIDDITFKNIPLEAKYSIEPAPVTGLSNMTSDWVHGEGSLQGWNITNKGNLTIKFPSDAPRTIQANTEGSLLFSSSDALLLLPNPDDPDLQVQLELNYTTNRGEKETVKALVPKGWNPGASVTLALRIANGLVQFSVSIEDWKDGSTTTTTVPRK